MHARECLGTFLYYIDVSVSKFECFLGKCLQAYIISHTATKYWHNLRPAMSLLVDGTTIENIKFKEQIDDKSTDENSTDQSEKEHSENSDVPKSAISTVELSVKGNELSEYLEKERGNNSYSSEKSQQGSELSTDSPKSPQNTHSVEENDQGSVLSQMMSYSDGGLSTENQSVCEQSIENQSVSGQSTENQSESEQSMESKSADVLSVENQPESDQSAENQSEGL